MVVLLLVALGPLGLHEQMDYRVQEGCVWVFQMTVDELNVDLAKHDNDYSKNIL